MLKSGPTPEFEGISNQTLNALPGVVFAGTVYVVILTTVNSLVWLPSVVNSNLGGAPKLVVDAAAVFVIIVVGSVFCVASVTFVVTIAMTIFNMTLSYAIPALTAGSLIGGITGFTIGLPVGYASGAAWSQILSSEQLIAAFSVLVGPVMGTVCCHLGAWYQVRKFHFLLVAEALPEEELSEQELSRAIASFDKLGTLSNQLPLDSEQRPAVLTVHPLDEPDDASHDQPDVRPVLSSRSFQRRRHSQWSLRQGFVLMTWVGVFAAFAAAAPEVGGAIAIAIGACGAIQLLSFGVLYCVWKRLDRRLCRVIIRFFEAHRVPVVGP